MSLPRTKSRTLWVNFIVACSIPFKSLGHDSPLFAYVEVASPSSCSPTATNCCNTVIPAAITTDLNFLFWFSVSLRSDVSFVVAGSDIQCIRPSAFYIFPCKTLLLPPFTTVYNSYRLWYHITEVYCKLHAS
jgi:hypothetical protein